jgi:DNA repair protein RadD
VEYKAGEYAEPTQGKVLVYDILNAGPRHRFTVNGLLVSNCLVLDFAGNVTRLGPINDPRVPKKRGDGPPGELPVKLCEQCGCLNHISARSCDNCGEPFNLQTKITERASTAEVIAREEPPKVVEFPVDRVTYGRHTRPGKPVMLKASYFCGLQRFTDYVLLEHYHSPVRGKAEHWWREHANPQAPRGADGKPTVPATVDEAEKRLGELQEPRMIRVWVNAERPQIMSRVFA